MKIRLNFQADRAIYTPIFCSIILLALLSSCKNKKEFTHELQSDSTNEFVIYLDSLTPPSTQMMQFLTTGEQIDQGWHAAMLNAEVQRINLHDQTGQKMEELSFESIGTDIPPVSGFHFIDSDSLLLFSYKTNTLLLASFHKKFAPRKLITFDTLQPREFSKVSIEVSSAQPMLYKNGVVYLTGKAMLNDFITKPSLNGIVNGVSYDLNSGITDYRVDFQSVWKERYWHNEQYYINQELSNGNLVYSLAMKDSIAVVNPLTGQQTKFEFKTDEFGAEEKMRAKNVDLATLGDKKDLMAYLEKPRYGILIFDSYRNVYYRFITNGNEDRETNVIICDKNFQKIGESKLPKAYLAGAGLFVAKEGIFLRKGLKGDDSKIVYTLFKLTKKA